MLKFNIFLFGCVVIFQSQQTLVLAAKADADEVKLSFDVSLPDNLKFANPIAEKTVSDILRHMWVTLTNKTSSQVIRHISSSVREVMLTPPAAGEEDNTLVKSIKAIGSLLKGENSSKLLIASCEGFAALANDEVRGDKLMRAIARSIISIFKQPNIVPATQGIVEGVNYFLDGMTPEKLTRGLKRLRTLNAFMSKMSAGKASTRSTTLMARSLDGQELEDALSLRNVGMNFVGITK